jgi:hypothetical protein
MKSRVPSLFNDGNRLSILEPSAQKVCFATMDKSDRYDVAEVRNNEESLFSSYPYGQPMYKIITAMREHFGKGLPVMEGFDKGKVLNDADPVKIVYFATDTKDVYASALKTFCNMIGIQTFKKDWVKDRDTVEPVWLGRCDQNTEASKLLNIFYDECHIKMYKAWSRKKSTKQRIQKTILPLAQARKPQFSLTNG